MDPELPAVIVNPRSGGGLSERQWARWLSTLTDGLGAFEPRFTERAGDGTRLAREETERGRKLVVAMGGDGTISEVANGILAGGGGAELGIIPRGTGGDFRRLLALPEDLGLSARRVRESRGRAIDVGRATFTRADGQLETRHFVNVASFGLSSDVASRANHSSKRMGAKAAFLSATMKSLLAYENIDVTLSVDGDSARRMTVLTAAIGNGRFFGGGMKICPDAALDDGWLDLVAVGDLGRWEVLAKLPRLYAGTHLSLSAVRAQRGRSIDAKPADPSAKIPIELDGETPGFLPARFEVVPGALRLRF